MKEVMWQFFEIVVNFYQGIVMIYFPFKYLGGKYSDKFIKNHGLIFASVLAAVISIFNYITIFEHFYTLLYLLIIFIYAFICLKSSIPKKIFASVYSLSIVTLSSITVGGITSIIFDKTFNDVLVENGWQRSLMIITTQLLIFYAMIISLYVLKNKNSKSSQLSKTELLLITLVLFMTIAIESLFFFVLLQNIDTKTRAVITISFVCLIIINIVILYIIIDLKNKNHSIMETEKLKLKLEYNRQYIENADTEYELIRKLRHDTKNIYNMINDLLKDGDNDKVKEYINRVVDIADDRMMFVKTENDVVNSVINAKLTIAKSFGINATCLSVDSFEGIDDIDLCRLLSNMIENAITATSYSKAKEKELVLRISKESERFLFLVKNSIDESVLSANPDLQTTKKSKNSHGYGTKIIRDIAESYNGHCDFYEEDDMFCCLAVLNPTINNRKRPEI